MTAPAALADPTGMTAIHTNEMGPEMGETPRDLRTTGMFFKARCILSGIRWEPENIKTPPGLISA